MLDLTGIEVDAERLEQTWADTGRDPVLVLRYAVTAPEVRLFRNDWLPVKHGALVCPDVHYLMAEARARMAVGTASSMPAVRLWNATGVPETCRETDGTPVAFLKDFGARRFVAEVSVPWKQDAGNVMAATKEALALAVVAAALRYEGNLFGKNNSA